MVSIELVVVMGGTLLTGGAGFGGGAFIGILIQDQLQTYIAFDGTLSNGWMTA
ncbi:simple sugar transport system permease protein [Rhizobium sp. SG570]|jgi:simple sugar transport system permease protein|nr:simple sugar transport system permease protein [Rhizobium sp. SG741]NKJ34684.1 simple sugar transport system permease protein [Rhizobium sp. SG570]